jgi:hypothetical protein
MDQYDPPQSGGKALAALGATALDDSLTAIGRHACAKAVAALTDEFARLIGSLHDCSPWAPRRKLLTGAGFSCKREIETRDAVN